MQRNILIAGEFNDAELAELMQAIRQIEQRHPEKEYHLMLLDNQPDGASAMDLVAKIFPVDPARGVDISFIPRTESDGCTG